MTTLWTRTLSLANQDIFTVNRKRFTFVIATKKRLDVSPEDGTPGKPIQIYRRDFDLAEAKISDFSTVQPKDLTDAGIIRGPTYIVGIMRTLNSKA